MITCVRYENLDSTASAFNAQFELRYKCFIERQNYNVRSYKKKEYDQYDTPATVYLVYQGDNGMVLGVSRLIPIRQACMINDLWPEMVENKSILEAESIWEGTRFCIEKDLRVDERRRIAQELVLSYLEFGIQEGIDRIIGVMPKLVLRTVFSACGIDYAYLGAGKIIDGIPIQAACMDVSHAQLIRARKKTGIYEPVLDNHFAPYLGNVA